ncbi:Peroxisomal acyl-coenzyme A oxidase 1 [Fonsecaea pedrosoi]|nr:Peroxisomal acyl-coenzyme A oxidase 1 [Fonsecaea pedrosoi]
MAPLSMSLNRLSLAKHIWGEDELRRRHEIIQVLSEFPLKTTCPDVYELSRRDLWIFRFQQSVEILELKMKFGWTNEHFLDALRIVSPDVSPLGVNYRKQQAYWIPKAEKYEISGSYAQTELGHGSNVKGIETTATFDPATDEFILDSPTVSSHKYWIGALGILATHALVVARLLVFGKDLGNHVFIVQVRDMVTHELEPNVLVYDQGPKSLGSFNTVDNGTMKFTNKRIPRSQMLAGMASLDRNGTYRGSTNSKHSYTSMVIIRGLMIAEIGQDVAKAVIIALRYTAFRRQFNKKDGKETLVINYASVKNRLYPALCRALPMMFFGRQVKKQIDNLKDSDPEDLHLQTVGGKIWVTERGVRDIEVARLCCGGQGNMAYAGLGLLHAYLSPSRTYEGDTYILSQQIGKAVVKHWKKAAVTGHTDWFILSNQEDFLERRSARLAQTHINETYREEDTSYDVRELAMAHADLTFWRALQSQVKQCPEEHAAKMEALANVASITISSAD